jgi:hypothetical protein
MNLTLSTSDCLRWRGSSEDKPAQALTGKTPRICFSDSGIVETKQPEDTQKQDKLVHYITSVILPDLDISNSWRDYQQKWNRYGMVDLPLQDCDFKPINIDTTGGAVSVSYAKQYMRLIDTTLKWRVVRTESPNARKFRRLAEQWYHETGMISMIHKKSMHPAYQRIIGMGKDALPFIFHEMKKKRAHWLWALSAIIDDDIAKPEHTLTEACEAWIKWGENNGYI